MKVWYKQGVCGQLQPIAQKGLGRVAALYGKKGFNFYVTSIQEGTHSPGSLHYCGMAFDFWGQGAKISEVKTTLGKDWDVIDEGNHYHAEYDPK